MRQRKTLPSLALIATLVLSVAPGRAVAQGEEPNFELGSPSPRGDRERGQRMPRPGFGRGGHGRGMMHPGGPGAGGPSGLRMALRNLNLSDSQREEIRTIFEAGRGQVEANHQQMRALGAELHEQIATDPYDEDAVRAKAAAVAAFQVEMAVLRARRSGEIRGLLTPEQLDELQQMKERRESFRDQRRERFERRRGPRSGS